MPKPLKRIGAGLAGGLEHVDSVACTFFVKLATFTIAMLYYAKVPCSTFHILTPHFPLADFGESALNF